MATPQGEERYVNGYIGRLAGFDLYVSNNVSNNGTTWRIITGSPIAWTFVEQIMSIEAYRPEIDALLRQSGIIAS